MALPFTADRFHVVFRATHTAVWPMRWALVAAAAAAMVAGRGRVPGLAGRCPRSWAGPLQAQAIG